MAAQRAAEADEPHAGSYLRRRRGSQQSIRVVQLRSTERRIMCSLHTRTSKLAGGAPSLLNTRHCAASGYRTLRGDTAIDPLLESDFDLHGG
jgi:hypothetical protein